jgi:hypothetical protein
LLGLDNSGFPYYPLKRLPEIGAIAEPPGAKDMLQWISIIVNFEPLRSRSRERTYLQTVIGNYLSGCDRDRVHMRFECRF